MKKILIIILSVVCCQSIVAQIYTLEQLRDSALCYNIKIRNAQHDIEAARHQSKVAFTKYFPNVSVTGMWFNTNDGMAQTSITPAGLIPPSLIQALPAEELAMLSAPIDMTFMKNGTIAGVSAMQPVFTGGQIFYGNKLAKVGEDVSRLQLNHSENEVEKSVEYYFWQLVSLEEKVKTLDAVEAMLNDLSKNVAVAVNAGVAMRNDLLQVQLRQNETESMKLTLSNSIVVLKQIIAQYCGLQDASFSITYQSETLPSLAIHQDHDQALVQTVEYKLLNKQVEAANLQKKMEIGKNLPKVAIGAGYNYHNLLDNDHTFGMIFASVSVPITDWWGGSHAIKRKKIEYQKAIEQRDDASELLKIKMQQAWNNVNTSYRQLSIAHRNIEQAKENLRLNQDYYKAGISKMSDLLEAQLLYQQACDKRTDAYIEYQNSLLEYRMSVGQ